MRQFSLLATLAAVVFGNTLAHGQPSVDFPNRTVRLIAAYPAGGPADTIGRILAQKLGEIWRQPVIVENRPGGGGTIGANVVAKAEPDGHTLLVGDSTLHFSQFTHKDLPFNPQTDFAPVALLTKATSLLLVRADGPTTASELIASARANPKKMNYGAGILTNRLAGHLFVEKSGIDVQFVPFKGSSEVSLALLNRSIDFSFDSITVNLSPIQSGRVRPLAKLGNVPIPALPDVPLLSTAANLPDLDDVAIWVGFVAPAGTPRAVIQKIQDGVTAAYADDAVVQRLLGAGIVATTMKTFEFDSYYKSESARWGRVFKSGNFKIE